MPVAVVAAAVLVALWWLLAALALVLVVPVLVALLVAAALYGSDRLMAVHRAAAAMCRWPVVHHLPDHRAH